MTKCCASVMIFCASMVFCASVLCTLAASVFQKSSTLAQTFCHDSCAILLFLKYTGTPTCNFMMAVGLGPPCRVAAASDKKPMGPGHGTLHFSQLEVNKLRKSFFWPTNIQSWDRDHKSLI